MINPVYKILVDDIAIRSYEAGKEDAFRLKEAVDSSLKHLHKYMQWSHADPEPIANKIKLIEGFRKDFLENKDFTYPVFRGEKLIASTGLHTSFEDNALEIGYWVRADETKKGLATKFVSALIVASFEKIGVDRLEIHYEIDNTISAKIPKKLKFEQKENYIHKTLGENARWILKKDDYQKNKSFYFGFFESISFYDVNNNEI